MRSSRSATRSIARRRRGSCSVDVEDEPQTTDPGVRTRGRVLRVGKSHRRRSRRAPHATRSGAHDTNPSSGDRHPTARSRAQRQAGSSQSPPDLSVRLGGLEIRAQIHSRVRADRAGRCAGDGEAVLDIEVGKARKHRPRVELLSDGPLARRHGDDELQHPRVAGDRRELHFEGPIDPWHDRQPHRDAVDISDRSGGQHQR